MPSVTRSVLLAHSAQQMFDLVADIEAYPRFLPWCGEAIVLERLPDGVRARLTMAFKGIRQSWTTQNSHEPGRRIDMRLVEGPFSSLEGDWHFVPLTETACRVEFRLEYAFSSRMLEKLIGPVFDMIARTFIDSFVKRADEVYAS